MPSSSARIVPVDSHNATQPRRKSSVHQEIADIVHAISTEGWSLRTIATFGISFIFSAILCGALASKAVSSNNFSHPAYFAFAVIGPTAAYVIWNAALRALVMIATENGTYLPGSILPDPPPPPSIHASFKETYGPYPTAKMSACFYVVTYLSNLCLALNYQYDIHVSSQHTCGEDAYYEMIWNTNTIVPRNVFQYSLEMCVTVYQRVVWAQYFHDHVNLPQDSSITMRAVVLGFPIVASWLFYALCLVPLWVTYTLYWLLTVVIFPINFIVDSNSRRASMGLPPVEYNIFYLTVATTMILGIVIMLSETKDAMLETGGATAASITVNIMGICFTFLFESLTVKASKLGQNGPFMFPLYFGIDLMNVGILLSVELFSFEFIALVFVQEGMGLCRNCGVFDIAWYIFKKMAGIGNDPFPLRSVAFLEELNTIAAVDSVSEILATFGLLALALGESLTAAIDGRDACGLVIKCDEENGRATKTIWGTFTICLVAFVFRATFFAFERAAFKVVMRHASNIESSAAVMATSVGVLRKAEQKETAQEELQKRPAVENQDSGRLEGIRQQLSATDELTTGGEETGRHKARCLATTKLGEEVITIVHDVTCLMESSDWRHWFFTKKTRVAVEEYKPVRGDTSAASTVFRKIKGCVITRTAMTLKTSIATLVEDHLNFLDPAKTEGGGERAILAGQGTDVRIMWSKVPMPSPLNERDSVFLEIVREYDFDGRRAVLVCGGPCTHRAKPKEKGLVRLGSLLFADFYEEEEGGASTKWTSLFASHPELPCLLRGLSRPIHAAYMVGHINMFASKYERDAKYDELVYDAEDRNAEKLNIANTVKKIFMGSKLYLFVAAVAVLFSVYYQTMKSATDAHFEAYWNSTGLCNATNN